MLVFHLMEVQRSPARHIDWRLTYLSGSRCGRAAFLPISLFTRIVLPWSTDIGIPVEEDVTAPDAELRDVIAANLFGF